MSISSSGTSVARRRLDEVLVTFDRKTGVSLYRLLHERVVLMENIALAYALMDDAGPSVMMEPQVLIRLKDALTDNTYHIVRVAQGRHEEVLSLMEEENVRLWLQSTAPVHGSRGRSCSPSAQRDASPVSARVSPTGNRSSSPRSRGGRSTVMGTEDGSPGRRSTLRLPAPTRLGRSSMGTHDLPTRKGQLAVSNQFAYLDGTAHLSYYQKQQVKYGKGRRGSTAVAGAWEQLFAEAEAAAGMVGVGVGVDEQGSATMSGGMYDGGSVTGSATGASCASGSSHVSLGRTRAGSLLPAAAVRLAQAPGQAHALGPIGRSAMDKGRRRSAEQQAQAFGGSGTLSSASSVADAWATGSASGSVQSPDPGREGGGRQVRSPTPGRGFAFATPPTAT